jgi:hypothetical protein
MKKYGGRQGEMWGRWGDRPKTEVWMGEDEKIRGKTWEKR